MFSLQNCLYVLSLTLESRHVLVYTCANVIYGLPSATLQFIVSVHVFNDSVILDSLIIISYDQLSLLHRNITL